jgi:hypothetical protein
VARRLLHVTVGSIPALSIVGLVMLAFAIGAPLIAQRESDRTAAGTNGRQPWLKPVPRAQCGKGDRVETGLQGQTTIAERMTGAAAKSYNCNLELVGQYQGEGANYQMAAYDECAYYGTSNREGQRNRGVVVVDAKDPRRPTAVTHLEARAMWDPWESLKVNVPRKLLAAIQADRGNGEQPGFAVYDISNCRAPVLKSAINLSIPVKGHAGNFAVDGRTYYGTQISASTYAIDIDKPEAPVLLGNWTGENGNGLPHDVSTNGAGDRLYTAQPGGLGGAREVRSNGLVISDVGGFQGRRANADTRILSTLFWKDGAVAQMTQRLQIAGKPYVIFTDEAGAGGIGDGAKAACAQNLPPFGFGRIIDISDDKNPRVVSKLMLEVHDPANCSAVQPDTGFTDLFGYSSHYCTPDSVDNAEYLACSYFEAGVRVFDIRDPYRPKEIAYYKPPARSAIPAGASNSSIQRHGNRSADWASSNLHWHRHGDELHLWFTSHENGFQIARFTNQLTSLVKKFPASGSGK